MYHLCIADLVLQERLKLRRIAAVLLIFVLFCNTVFASDTIKFYGGIQNDFLVNNEVPEYVNFITNEDVNISDELTIPAGALITAKVHQYQKERRWHKSGFFVCNIEKYSSDEGEVVDISDDNIYFIVRKYDALNKKEASILATEIVLTQAASIVASCFIIFAPVDVAYFFTKGAIVRKKHPNWFKSGVMEAYDNSIFWFQLKGKPIELAEGDSVKLKSISKERADKINGKIERKNYKKELREQKREIKKLKKANKANKNQNNEPQEFEFDDESFEG